MEESNITALRKDAERYKARKAEAAAEVRKAYAERFDNWRKKLDTEEKTRGIKIAPPSGKVTDEALAADEVAARKRAAKANIEALKALHKAHRPNHVKGEVDEFIPRPLMNRGDVLAFLRGGKITDKVRLTWHLICVETEADGRKVAKFAAECPGSCSSGLLEGQAVLKGFKAVLPILPDDTLCPECAAKVDRLHDEAAKMIERDREAKAIEAEQQVGFH